MFKIDPADDEITIFGCIFVFLLVIIVGSVGFGLRFFFRELDDRMNRRLDNYIANKKPKDEQE